MILQRRILDRELKQSQLTLLTLFLALLSHLLLYTIPGSFSLPGSVYYYFVKVIFSIDSYTSTINN